MAEANDKEDPNFNPMHIEEFRNREAQISKGTPQLYDLAMSDFKQQNMTAWRPIPTLYYSVGIFLIIALLCFAFGIPLLILSADIVEVKQRYDDICDTYGGTCTVPITIEKEMKGTVHVYYQLENFYQNHRIYMKSYSLEQLKGEFLPPEKLDECEPVVHITDIAIIGYTTNPANVPNQYETLAAHNAPAYPCGLIAKSMFNDTYSLISPSGESIDIKETGIAWKDDIGIYKNADLAKQWIDVTNEHFIVWMQTAGLPDFRKRWGRIEQDLAPGEYKLIVANNYDMRKFSGKKYLVLSTANAFGGNNYILGGFFVGVAVLSIILCVVFLIAYKSKQTRETVVVIDNTQ